MRGALGVRLVCLTLFTLAPVLAAAQPPAEAARLWRQVTIYRDAWGVPHIYGDNLRAMAFGFGYAQAADHSGRMLMAYRVANGRAAAAAGPEYAESDALAIKLGHAELARQALAEAGPVTRQLCEGFAVGVNAWLAEHADTVPRWAEPIHPADILALWHCYLMSFAPMDAPDVYHMAPGTPSANAWALGPPRTASGQAILVINPHSDYDSPFQWYEAHLVSQGVNVAGATLYGLPVIAQGHNERLGWALSPNEADFADVYIERPPEVPRNPAIVNRPLLDESVALYFYELMRRRTYEVRTPQGMQRRSVQYFPTRHGPVIAQRSRNYLTWRIGGYGDFSGIEQLFRMGQARNLAEFQAALALRGLPCFHIVYADGAGNTSYLYNANAARKYWPGGGAERQRAPLPEGVQFVDWRRPVSGDVAQFEWGPPIPLEALPSVTNPASGYVQACGTPPWNAAGEGAGDPAGIPPWLAGDADTGRAQRARRLIETKPLSFYESQSMLYDTVAPHALEAVPALREAANAHEVLVTTLHPDVPAALEVLDQWGYAAEPDSPAMTLFHVWLATYKAQAQGAGGDYRAALQQLASGAPEAQTIALRSLSQAVRLMMAEFGTLAVPWGDVHTRIHGGQEVAFAGCGLGESLLFASDARYGQHRWPVTAGYGFAMVTQFGAYPQSASVVPFGASEEPSSPHYDDQLQLFLERRLKVTDFRHDDVQRHAEHALGTLVHLRPRGSEALVTLRSGAPVRASLVSGVEGPAPLPGGLAPATVFFRPVAAPAPEGVSAEIEAYIPPPPAGPASLEGAAVLGFHADAGWQALPNQRTDANTRIVRAVSEGLTSFVVAAPAAAFEGSAGLRERLAGELPGADEEGAEFPADARTVTLPSGGQAPFGGTPPAPGNAAPPGEPAEGGPPVDPEGYAHAGPLAHGKKLDLEAPGVDARFQINAELPIGARLVTLDKPPAPVPPERTPATPFVRVESNDPAAPMEVVMSFRLPEAVWNSGRPALYAYDAKSGWAPLPGQLRTDRTRRVSGLDTSPRIYAVLLEPAAGGDASAGGETEQSNQGE